MRLKRIAAVVASLALTAALLWLVFRGADWTALLEKLRNAHLGWILISTLIIWVSFFTRVLRWSYIVRAASPASFRSMFSATQIGFLANFVLIYRAGELIRAFVLGRLTGIPFTKGVAMVTLDRVTDLAGLVIVLLVAMVAFHQMGAVTVPASLLAGDEPFTIPPMMVQIATWGATLAIVIFVAVLVLLYVNQVWVLEKTGRVISLVSPALALRVNGWLVNFAHGLQVFRSPGDMAKSLFFSLLTWACFVLSFMSSQQAFGIEAPWYTPFVVQALLAVAIVIPVAPGFVGQFHFGIVAGLLVSAQTVAMADAQALAIVVHLLNLGSVVVAGVACLWLEHMGLFELRREAEIEAGTLEDSDSGRDSPPAS